MNESREFSLQRSNYMVRQFGREFEAKSVIAKWIVEKLVDDFKAVLLDTGSTAELVAKELFHKRRYLSILTNNMGAYVQYTNPSIDEKNKDDFDASLLDNEQLEKWKKNVGIGLTNGNELLITGGLFNPIHEGLYGQDAIKAINNFHPNISIIGVSGLTDKGLYGRGKHDSEVKEIMLKRPAEIRIAITDWTKIGKTDAHLFGSIADFGRLTSKAYIVTNTPPTEKQLIGIPKGLLKNKIELVEELQARIEKFHETKEELKGFEVDAKIEFIDVPFTYNEKDLLKIYFGIENTE